jgi:hypothetical protein
VAGGGEETVSETVEMEWGGGGGEGAVKRWIVEMAFDSSKGSRLFVEECAMWRALKR